MRAFLTARWAPVVGALATVFYAGSVLAFGLDYRPLHNDEGVTLQVAQEPSVRDVLQTAIDHRHGPPLHYLLVHMSLLWHDDVLGLRLPSALLGILAVALSYWLGRELLGPPGGALVSVITAISPAVVNLAQFARGYTAMLAACYGSLWILLVMLRTRSAKLVIPYAITALLLAAAHPFGLFALLSELILLVCLWVWPMARSRTIGERRPLIVLGAALLLGACALVGLRQVYAPLQHKYGVGNGSQVVDVASTRFWAELGSAWSGSGYAFFGILLGVACVLGVITLWTSNRRAAFVCTIWLLQPLISLSVLTAASSDFAPQRHLSFLIPGYAVATAAFLLELARRLGARRGVIAVVAVMVLLYAPSAVAVHNNVGTFTSDLRDASLYLGQNFEPGDVLLTSAGQSEAGAASRLYGAYAVLEARSNTPLGSWRQVGDATGCDLIIRLHNQQSTPREAWLLLRPPNPPAAAQALQSAGADEVQQFGNYVVARFALSPQTIGGALKAGITGYTAVLPVSQSIHDFGIVGHYYRTTLQMWRGNKCVYGRSTG
jgi:hypothetical protein